jgi:hypothetical protein
MYLGQNLVHLGSSEGPHRRRVDVASRSYRQLRKELNFHEAPSPQNAANAGDNS